MSTYLAALIAEAGIATLGALSVYVILSTGQLSLGNAGFMAFGAYLSSFLTATMGMSVTLALLVAALGAAMAGAVVGFPALRLKGIFLAMATLGFGEMVRSFLLNFEPLGGSNGFHGMPHVGAGYVWSWTGVMIMLVMLAERSRLWLDMQAVRDDETAAALIGIDTTRVKVAAFSCGAAMAALAGGLFAHHHVYIEPGNFAFDRSIDLVLSVILGGSTLALGSAVGAALLTFLPEALRSLADYRLIAFGVLLITVLLLRPQGLVQPSLFRWFDRGRAP